MPMLEPLKLTVEQKNLLESEEKRKAFMYTGIAMSRNNEVTLRWSRSSILSLINGAGFSLLGAQLSNHIPVLYLILGIFGMLLCAFWRILNWKTQLWINYWHSCLAKMEPPAPELFVFRVFTGKEWEKVNEWPTFHGLLNFLPYTFGFLWICIGVTFAFVEKKEPPKNPTTIFFQLNTNKGGVP